MNDNNLPKVKSLAKALELLCLFDDMHPELGVCELAELSGLYKSNVSNILATYEQYGFVVKSGQSGKYRLGLKLLELAHTVTDSFGIYEVVHERIAALSERLQETVYYAIPDNLNALYIDGVFKHSLHASRPMGGVTAPLYCTGIGKAMLAFLPDDAIRRVLTSPLTRFTDNTITEAPVLADELTAIRSCGYALDNMEHEYGVKCVGVPVLACGNVIGGLSASGPSLRFPPERIAEIAEELKRAAAEIGQDSRYLR